MPDELVFAGIRVTRQAVPVTQTGHGDRERVVKLAEIDCHPPPGATTDFLKPESIEPIIFERFFQPEELNRLGAIARRLNPHFPNHGPLIALILGGLGFPRLTILYDKSYRDLLAVVPGHIVTVYLRVRFQIYDIKVAAAENLTIGANTFPSGDEIATFRVAEPKQYRFETLNRRNPLCDGVAPVPDRTSLWTPSSAEELPPIDWNFDGDWWQIRPRLRRTFGD